MSNHAEERVRRKKETTERWGRIAYRLARYANSVSPGSCFPSREGQWVTAALAILLVCGALSAAWPQAAFLFFVVTCLIGLDILVVNTSIVFVTGRAVNPLRSALFTIIGYFNLGLAFVPLWIGLCSPTNSSAWDRLTRATYESVRTLSTAGPTIELGPWGRVLAIAELVIGVYFLVIVFAVYASWARREPGGAA